MTGHVRLAIRSHINITRFGGGGKNTIIIALLIIVRIRRHIKGKSALHVYSICFCSNLIVFLWLRLSSDKQAGRLSKATHPIYNIAGMYYMYYLLMLFFVSRDVTEILKLPETLSFSRMIRFYGVSQERPSRVNKSPPLVCIVYCTHSQRRQSAVMSNHS